MQDGERTRTLIVGCGSLGIRLGERLLQRGGEVHGLRRDVSALPTGFHDVAADLGEPDALRLPDVDVLVFTLPPSGAPAGYRAALGAVRAALPTPPRRTVFVSSTGVFAEWNGPQPITEADQPRPTSARSTHLLDGERAARDLFGASIVRPAGIYGPGRDFLIRVVRDARPVDHDRMTNRIHEVDLARALDTVVHADTAPATLHAVDTRPAPLGEVLAHIAGRLQRPLPPHQSDERPTGNRFDGAALHRLLGQLDYPDYRAGYDDMLRSAPEAA